MFFFMAIVLIRKDAALALVTMLPIPLIAWLVHRVRRQLSEGFQQSSRAFDEMTSILADTIPGIRVVKAFAQENREIERFAQANNRILAANERVNVVWSFFWHGDRAADANRPDRHLGIRRLADLRTSQITVGVLTAFLAYIAPVLCAARIDEPLFAVHGAGRQRRPPHLRDSRPRPERRRAG